MGMKQVFRNIDIHRCAAIKRLMRTTIVVLELPQLQLIPPLLATCKSHSMEQLLVVCAMAPLNDSVLPRRPRLALSMDKTKLIYKLLKRAFPLRMGAKPHGELEGIVGPDEERGGSRSKARLRTPATVKDLRSGWISEYLRRVRR